MSPICKQINTEKHYVLGAAVSLGLLAILYMYCVSSTVVHVVATKETNRAIADMNSALSQLEAEYIAAQHAVSATVATLPGFVETPDKIFIERTNPTLVVRDRVLP